ncbi:MAG TPA: hypothetical protein VFA77_08730 [Candidatus Eisenbacteria bacterium]|jgi:hypothetical protein|nr:hypothetical protein [Candidatus Eisenbacteria bacterium]
MAVELMLRKTDGPFAKRMANGGAADGLTRRKFLRLPLAQRRKILKAQALAARTYYAQSIDWREWEAADLTSPADE